MKEKTAKIVSEIEELAKLKRHMFKFKDVLQVLVGASLLAIPIGFTDEAWKLGEVLPMANIIGLLVLSLVFISLFTYYHYHHEHPKSREHLNEFLKRVLGTYIISFLIVSLILTIIQATPWQTDQILAFKRATIVAFPASLGAAITDTLR